MDSYILDERIIAKPIRARPTSAHRIPQPNGSMPDDSFGGIQAHEDRQTIRKLSALSDVGELEPFGIQQRIFPSRVDLKLLQQVSSSMISENLLLTKKACQGIGYGV